MHINLEALLGVNLKDVIYGVTDPVSKQYIPGLAHRLVEHYKPSPVVVLDDPNKVDDEFISFHTAMVRHVSMGDHTKSMFIMAGRANVYEKWFPRNREKIVITTNILFGGAVGARNTFKHIRVPHPQGQGFQQYPPMVAAYAFHRHATEHCYPDLVLSYEPPLDILAKQVNEPIEKVQLAANAYAYMKAAYIDEIAERAAQKSPVKSAVVPLAPVGVTQMPATHEVIQAMFDVVVQAYPKQQR
jgi:hypothetical protein